MTSSDLYERSLTYEGRFEVHRIGNSSCYNSDLSLVTGIGIFSYP